MTAHGHDPANVGGTYPSSEGEAFRAARAAKRQAEQRMGWWGPGKGPGY